MEKAGSSIPSAGLFFDKFSEKFSSTRCREVVKQQFGRYYDLNVPEERNLSIETSKKDPKCFGVVKSAFDLLPKSSWKNPEINEEWLNLQIKCLCYTFASKAERFMTKKKYVLRDDLALPREKPPLRFADDLNDSQIEAVTTLDGPVLVIAGAGTGKTRTLVYRLAYMADAGISPKNVLLLTFTRRSAEEMLRRAESLVSDNHGRAEGGTFHSMAAAILRKYASVIGYPNNFTILDVADSTELIGRCRTASGIDFKKMRFPRKITLQKVFSKSINKSTPVEFVLYDEYPQYCDFQEPIEKIRIEYEELKKNRGMMDFDDLLLKLIELMKENEQIRKILQNQYRYLMIDEYQDTNPLQAEIIELLAGKKGNVMVVGDDSQSIYAFRGANYRNILDFPSKFNDTKIIKLERNYRSTQQILDVANNSIERAVEKYTKVLSAERGNGNLPVVIAAEDESFQSRFVTQKLLEHREDGIDLNQMAVLVRSSRLSSDLELELAKRNIPFEKRGGLRFFESAHIKDLIAHIKLVSNSNDELSWLRVLKLVDGIGEIYAERILQSIFGATDPIEELLKQEKPKTTSFMSFKRLMNDIYRMKDTTAPIDMLQRAHEYYQPILEDRYDNYPQRKRDIEHLQGIASRYRSLDSFVSDLSIEPQDRFADVGDELDPDMEKLTISTIHSAKGLEWRVVFLIWTLEGRFPSSFTVLNDEALEEERRLFYVCVTRAKEHIYILYPVNIYDRRSRVMCQPSRFLEELDSSLYEQWDLTEDDDAEDEIESLIDLELDDDPVH